LEHAVAAIEPRVTGRAFLDTATRACGVADSGTSVMPAGGSTSVIEDARYRARLGSVQVRQDRHLEDAVAAIGPRVTGRAFPDTAT